MSSFEPSRVSETTPGNIKAFGGSGGSEHLSGRPLARFPTLVAVVDFLSNFIAGFRVPIFVLRKLNTVEGYLVVEW